MKEKLSICFVICGFPPVIGGAERYTMELAENLASRGHNVRVLTRASPTAPGKESLMGGRLDVRRFYSTNVPGLRMLIFMVRVIWAIFRGRKNIDVIHAIHAFSPGFIALAASKITGIPLVIRDGPSLDAIGAYVCNPVVKMLMGYTLKNAMEVYVDHALVEKAYLGIGARRGHIRTLENPVDSGEFKPDPSAKERLGFRGKFVVLNLGRLQPFKGVEDLINAAPEINRRVKNAVILIVGYGPDEARLREIAWKTGAKNIVFYGKVPFEKAHEVYASADVFVQPSVSAELPNTIIQSMSAGNAIIATNLVGSKALLKDGRTAVIIKPGDPKAIAAAVSELHHNPRRMKALGKNARRLIMERSGWRSHTDAVLGIYRKVIGGAEGD